MAAAAVDGRVLVLVFGDFRSCEEMGLSGAGGAALHTLRLASSVSAAVRRCRIPLPRALLASTAARSGGPSAPRSRRLIRRGATPLPRLVRAFSASALQDTAVLSEEHDRAAAAASAKPRWKAAIDFKWIRDNKDVVAANIKNRNSIADFLLLLVGLRHSKLGLPTLLLLSLQEMSPRPQLLVRVSPRRPQPSPKRC